MTSAVQAQEGSVLVARAGGVSFIQEASASLAAGAGLGALSQALAQAQAARWELDCEIGRGAAIALLGRIAGIFKAHPTLRGFCLIPRSMDLGLEVDCGDGGWTLHRHVEKAHKEGREPPVGWEELHGALEAFCQTPRAPDWGIMDESWHGELVKPGSILDACERAAHGLGPPLDRGRANLAGHRGR